MAEFFNTIFNPANALPTAFLVFVLIYWIIVIAGFIGTDFLDFDLDMDADSSSADIAWINHILVFFNLGKIPIMIWLSFLVFPLWLISININALLGFTGFLPGLLVFIPALFVSLFFAKILTWPFVRFFNTISEDSKEKEVLGRIGTVTIAADAKSSGQAEIDYRGSSLRMSIRTRKNVSVAKGQKVLFVQPIGNKGIYLVEPYLELE